jgi:hypothetical protein
MTRDEKALLKHGLFWAFVVAGFLLLVSVIQNRAVTVIAQIIWLAFFYWIFHRAGDKEKSN